MTGTGWTILVLLCVHYGVERLADLLNLRALSRKVPPSFAGWYDPDRYANSRAYLKNTTGLAMVEASVDLAILLAFWFARGFGFLDRWVSGLGFSPIVSGLVFIGVLICARAVFSLPFSIYSTFVTEERFGFNRTTWPLFLSDRIKGLFLVLLLGTPLLTGLLWFFENVGQTAWLWCWIGFCMVMLVLQVVVPAWILPLFNRFTPLEPGDLKTAVLACARAAGFPVQTVFVMDGSKRSAKSNAFFAGLGRHRRLVLFDTLIDNHPVSEVVAVVAHEIGHYKNRHLQRQTLVGMGQAGVMFFLLSVAVSWPDLFAAFYVSNVSVYGGLVFFSILYGPVAEALGLPVYALSRHHEFQADAFAAKITGNGPALAEALKRLSANNMANLTPHPFYVLLHYSHPPVIDRIAAIEKSEGTRASCR
ncbi:MAG: M48 family metallopeptidase [Thermodesulfobacteriota bacterium]|nr:M48 family metallopeptidase [Thermodesulfobacteriota bacterium]